MEKRRIDRLDQYMSLRHLNDNKVSRQLGLSNGTIGKSRKEGRDLSDRVVEQILKSYPELNGEWLMTGEGEMLIANSGKNSQVIGTNSGTAINGDGAGVVRRMQDQIDELISQNSELISIIKNLTMK